MGAWGQEQMQRMEEGRRQAMRQVGTSIVTGIVSSFIPGGGYIQQAQSMAQAQQQRAQAAQNQREIMALGANMEAILPNMYRGQRLHELGQRKQCAFAQGPGAPPQ
jgi:transposase